MRFVPNDYQRLARQPFLRFGLVGSMAFVLSSLILYLLYARLKLNIIIAQFVSAEGGVIFNFIVHNNWTFRHQDHPNTSVWRKLLQFHASSWAGVAWLTGIVSIGVTFTNLHYLLWLAAATAFVMFWNYYWSKTYIFGRRDTAEVSKHHTSA